MKRTLLYTYLVTASVFHLSAATTTWTGGGANANWSTFGNWSSGALPDVADDVTIGSGFASGGTLLLGANRTINSLTLTSSSASPITFGDGFALTISSGNLFVASDNLANFTFSHVNSNVILGGSAATVANDSGQKLTLGRVTVIGNTLTFAASNPASITAITMPLFFTGTTSVTGGILQLAPTSGYNSNFFNGSLEAHNDAQIQLTVANALPWSGSGNYAAPVTLYDNSSLVIAASTAQGVGSLSSSSATTGVTINSSATLRVGLDGSASTFAGIITGPGTLEKGGRDTKTMLTLTGDSSSTFTGKVSVNSGDLVLAGDGAIGSTDITLFERLTLDNSVVNKTNRISNSAFIKGQGGELVFIGNDSALSSETFGRLLPTNGFGSGGAITITVKPGAGQGAVLTFDQIGAAGATLLRGDNLGGSSGQFSQIKAATAPNLKGGAGANGTSTKSIIAYTFGDTSSTGSGSGFVTYDASVGVRMLSASEYSSTISNGSSVLHNVKLSGTAITGINSATSVNSLWLADGSSIAGSGAVTINAAAILATGEGTQSIDVPLNMHDIYSINTVSNLTISGNITATGNNSLNKIGSGTLTLSGNNSFSAASIMQIQAGTLLAASSNALGTTTKGVVEIGSKGTLLLANGVTLSNQLVMDTHATLGMAASSGDTATYTGSINPSFANLDIGTGSTLTISSHSGAIGARYTKIGAGTLILGASLNANNFSDFYAKDGTIIVQSTTSLGSNIAGSVVTDGATVAFQSTTSTPLSISEGFSVSGAGYSGTGALLGKTGSGPGAADSVTLTGAVSLQGNTSVGAEAGASFVMSGVTSGAFRLTKVGNGNLTLSGANTYSGGTALNGGTLTLGHASALGSSGAISFGGGTLRHAAGFTADYSGRFSTAANQAYSVDTNGQNVTWAAALTSSGGSLTKLGAGILTLNAAGTYNGGTTISGGTLRLGVANALSAAGAVSLANEAGVILDLNNRDQTLGSLSGGGASGGNIAMGSGNLKVGDTANTAFAGAISGSGAFTKQGTGKLTLTGSNSYTGATLLSAGSLIVNGSIASSSGISVSAGATLEGSGSVSAISGAGKVGPGNSPGILTATSVDPTGGLGFAFELTQTGDAIWSSATASGNDVLHLTSLTTPITGALTTDNSIDLYFSGQGTYRGGFFTDKDSDFSALLSSATYNAYVLDASGSFVYNGNNYSLLGGDVLTISTVQIESANFAGGTVTNGWTQQFTVVPEPSNVALIIGGIAMIGFAVRRRH